MPHRHGARAQDLSSLRDAGIGQLEADRDIVFVVANISCPTGCAAAVTVARECAQGDANCIALAVMPFEDYGCAWQERADRNLANLGPVTEHLEAQRLDATFSDLPDDGFTRDNTAVYAEVVHDFTKFLKGVL